MCVVMFVVCVCVEDVVDVECEFEDFDDVW